jgi:hypothetical protein
MPTDIDNRQREALRVSSAAMNDYDKAGRYLIKRDPPGFFRWLLRRPDVSFHAWIDARRHALPDQGDLTNDLVVAFRVGDAFEALCVELQAESEGGSAARLLLGYLPRLLTEPATADSLPLTTAGGIVVNLTGPPQPDRIEHRPTLAPGCWLSGGIEQRTLRTEGAAATLAEIAAGNVSRWLLAWLPLMRGGADAGIIEGWKREVVVELSGTDQRLLAELTRTFAGLAGCRPVWQRGLEGWAVIKSEYLEELREAVRTEAKAEGRAEELRAAVLDLGRQRFGKAATRKQKARVQAIADLAHLQRIRNRLLIAPSWDDLLSTP